MVSLSSVVITNFEEFETLEYLKKKNEAEMTIVWWRREIFLNKAFSSQNNLAKLGFWVKFGIRHLAAEGVN